MTQEEKARAYDEALERAKSFQQKFGGDYAGYIFPELRESEDERIIKIIIDCLQHDASLSHQDVDDCITYLEKQKEQKPAGNKKEEMTEFEQSVYDLCPVLGIEEAKATASDLLELAKKTLLKTGKVVLTSNYPEGCSFEDGFHLGYNEGFNTKQKEQKPAESSNEDAIQKAYKEGINDGIALVKKQPEDYGLQKLAKWSEGDETCLQDVPLDGRTIKL